MKVLFAVSSESISDAIVKKYQKEYKEILSYKNVYYFNAILKEIQKDKTYDRIVISEDLEAFSNTQYSQIDKFIFDKLDSISDEASNLKGDDIPYLARIAAIADTYDAMTSKRSYRNPLPLEKVISEFERCKGTQFDPHIADIMLQMIDEDKNYTLHSWGS